MALKKAFCVRETQTIPTAVYYKRVIPEWWLDMDMFLEIGRVFCGLLSVQLHSVLELDFSVSQQKWMFYKPFEVPNIK